MSNIKKLLEGVEVEWKTLGEITNIPVSYTHLDFLIMPVDAYPHLVKHTVRFECRRASARDTSTFGVPQ